MFTPGSLHGRYEIRSLLGAGGMGEVYLAHDAQLQRPVALKVLPAEMRGDVELRRRLENEARTASALNHPNILTVYDIGLLGEDHFIAMEFVDGITLRQRMQRGEVTLHEVVGIASQIASALEAAQAVGLVHRDIKPDNIMIRTDGYVKLLDFGLALMTTSKRRRDIERGLRGTVFYMSPEQLRGTADDTRTDIWSLGVVLYELVSGHLPFEGENLPDVAGRILHAEPRPLVAREGLTAPERLVAIVKRAMEKDRSERYSHAREVLDDLLRLRNELNLRDSGPHVVSPSAPTELIHFNPEKSNLPHPLTGLLGRDSERDEVLALLKRDDVRIVTLTGAGGTGKTRLSIAIAEELRRDYADGVWWISLGPILDARLVISEIASVLGIQEAGVALLDAVRSHLRDRSLLLVLDNFEQLLGAAPVIAQLLAAAPGVKALITSRGALQVRGEREYAVPPLTLPPLEQPLTPQELMNYASVRLFVERATAVHSDFVLTAVDASAIAEICVRLEGLPLAIELAAARIRLLPPQAMLARVGSRFKLLSSGARDLPERHQTMRAAIAWGYNLLEENDKALFATLSVFRGGFSLDAAEQLAGGDVLDGIASLIDKAFLRRDREIEATPRYSMLETIRDYGLECLTANGQRLRVHLAHARIMAGIAEQHELETNVLAVDEGNFRTALESAIVANDVDLALRLGGSLWWFWYVRGLYGEGRRWLDQVLAVSSGDHSSLRAKTLTGAGAMAFLQCDYDRAISLLESSIELSRTLGDGVSLARSLQFRGSIARERGDYDRAIELHERSRALWLELGDSPNASRSLNYIAFASWLKGDVIRAVHLGRRMLEIFQGANDAEGIAWSLLNLAAGHLYSGEIDTAEKRLEESLVASRAAGYKEGVAWALNLRGLVKRERGDPAAADVLKESLRMQWELGDRWRSASLLEALGGVCRDPRLLGAAALLRQQLHAVVPPVELVRLDQDLAAVGVSECSIEEGIAIALGTAAL